MFLTYLKAAIYIYREMILFNLSLKLIIFPKLSKIKQKYYLIISYLQVKIKISYSRKFEFYSKFNVYVVYFD